MAQNGHTHYTPQHPLPAPIQEMARDETVCQYCGVSYLIHNEIKALEEKLEAAEKELHLLRGAAQREADLQHQMEQQKDIITLLKAESAQKDECVSSLQGVLQSSEDKLKIIQEGQNDLSRTSDKLRQHNAALKEQIGKTSLVLKQQQKHMVSLKDEVKKLQMAQGEMIKKSSAEILQLCKKYMENKNDLESRVGVIAMENSMLTKSSRTLKDEVAKYKAQVESLTASQSKHDELKVKMSKLESEISSLTTTNRQLTLETQQFKEQIRIKSKENEDVVSQSKKHQQHLETSVGQLSGELQGKIADLAAAQKKLREMEQRFVEAHQKELEVTSRTAATINESKELKEVISRLRGDMEALKEERELLITSHQNRIEQLRESFKNKLSEAEHWPEKLEQALKSEREKHLDELTEFSKNVKADFVVAALRMLSEQGLIGQELQVEKDKYDKLMEKYQAEHRGKDAEVEMRLSELQNQHERDLTNMRIKFDSDTKLLREEKQRCRDTEADLRREVANLKSIISNLEERLGNLSQGSVEETQTLKENLHRARLEVDEACSLVKEYEGKLTETKEEIVFLQETVRKECEERFELTEKLSDARRELLSLKRPAGGYISSAGSQRSSVYGDVPRKSGSVMSLNSVTSQPASGRNDTSPPSELTQTNNINYHGESAKPVGKIRGDSIADHRRRIASMLGKR